MLEQTALFLSLSSGPENIVVAQTKTILAFTITSEDEWCRRAEHFVPGHSVVDHTGVVANVGALHLGDVQTPRFLRDEATTVLLDETRVLVEDPGVRQLWVAEVKRSLAEPPQDESTFPKFTISLASVISVFLGGTTAAREITISAEEGKGAKQNGLQRASGPPLTHGLHSVGPKLCFMGGQIDVWKQGCVLMPLHKR